jgi:hypothetical protein
VCIRTANVHACACAGAGVCAAAATGGLTQDQWTAHLASPAFQSRLWVLVTAMEMGSMDLVPSPHVYALGHHEGVDFMRLLRMVFSAASFTTSFGIARRNLRTPSTCVPLVVVSHRHQHSRWRGRCWSRLEHGRWYPWCGWSHFSRPPWHPRRCHQGLPGVCVV